MRIFVLEDDQWRRKTLTDSMLAPNDEITSIDSCQQAFMFNPPYDLILLDHDLGGRQFEQHEDCGLTFVRTMERYFNAYTEGLVIIHSYNFDGAKAMAATLKDHPNVHVAPFGGPKFLELLAEARRAWELRYYGKSSKSKPKAVPASAIEYISYGTTGTGTISTS